MDFAAEKQFLLPLQHSRSGLLGGMTKHSNKMLWHFSQQKAKQRQNDNKTQVKVTLCSFKFRPPQLHQSADLWEGGKSLPFVSGSHCSMETAAMAVEAAAVASQFNTRWSTLLLSSSTASGLRHHQQHRSMTSQPHPGPCRPASPRETSRPSGSDKRFRFSLGAMVKSNSSFPTVEPQTSLSPTTCSSGRASFLSRSSSGQ